MHLHLTIARGETKTNSTDSHASRHQHEKRTLKIPARDWTCRSEKRCATRHLPVCRWDNRVEGDESGARLCRSTQALLHRSKWLPRACVRAHGGHVAGAEVAHNTGEAIGRDNEWTMRRRCHSRAQTGYLRTVRVVCDAGTWCS